MNQYIVNIIISTSLIMFMSISFFIIFNILKIFHFAHAIIFTFSCYISYFFVSMIGYPMLLSISLTIVITSILGVLMEYFIYRSLRKRAINNMIVLLASLGIYILIQNLLSLIFGDETKSIRSGVVKEGLDVFGARITPIQIVIIATAVVVLISVILFMKKTRIGIAMQAVASDADLANISGINSERVILWAFAIGSGLAGLAGILYALDVDMTPTMGMPILMMGIVAMIVGGAGSIPGIALGALLLGFAKNFGAYYIGSQWQDAIAFMILLVFLIFRPQGFLGKKVRSSEV